MNTAAHEQIKYRVDLADENRFGEKITETDSFQTLIEAVNFAYEEYFKLRKTILNIHTIDLETGAITILHNRQEVYTMFVNREHDEQIDRMREDEPQQNPDGTPLFHISVKS